MSDPKKSEGRSFLLPGHLTSYEFPLREVVIPKSCTEIVLYIGGSVNQNVVDGTVHIPITDIPVRQEPERLIIKWPDLVALGVAMLEELEIDAESLAGLNAVLLSPLEAATRYLVAEESLSSSAGYARLYCSTAGRPLLPLYTGTGKAVFPLHPGWNIMEALCVRGVESSVLKLHRVGIVRRRLERITVWKGEHWRHLPGSMESYRHVLRTAEFRATGTRQ